MGYRPLPYRYMRKQRKPMGPLGIISIGATVMVIIGVSALIYARHGREVKAEVKQLWWERLIHAQEIRTFVEQCTGEPPIGAVVLDHWTSRYVSGHIKIGEVYVPQYSTRHHYKYEIDRWVTVKTFRAADADGEEPYWPEYYLEEGQRKVQEQSYGIQLKCEDGKIRTWELPQSRWDEYEYGELVTLKISLFGNVMGDV